MHSSQNLKLFGKMVGVENDTIKEALFKYELIVIVSPDALLKILPKTLLILTKRHDFEFIGIKATKGQIEVVMAITLSTITRIAKLFQNIIEVENVVFNNVT